MPYIITTHTPYHDEERGADSIDTRTAVATLDEARRVAAAEVALTYAIAAEVARPYANEGAGSVPEHSVPDHGGTIGPLPDGTVIEVESLAWVEMAHRAGLTLDELPTDAAILDAFNAR